MSDVDVCRHAQMRAADEASANASPAAQPIRQGMPDLRFPHISSCEIKHLVGHAVEEGARMG
ncbi:hypothetical protein WKG43_19405, partial [Xanthomonas oryzae pv. oryzae]